MAIESGAWLDLSGRGGTSSHSSFLGILNTLRSADSVKKKGNLLFEEKNGLCGRSWLEPLFDLVRCKALD